MDARMSSVVFVHRNGLGLALFASMKDVITSWRAATLRWTPRA